MRLLGLLLLTLLVGGCEQRKPEPAAVLRVAVAANFAPTLKTLAAAYNKQREAPLEIKTMVGSSGLLTAQIAAGAPYDLFFAADASRPQKLVEADQVAGQAQSYALGRLVLWMPQHEYKAVQKRLQEGDYGRLAIANPDLAPYGAAAREVLRKLGLWAQVQDRLVRGENIGQAFHYVVTERVDMGFVAQSQLGGQLQAAPEEAFWQVPASMYGPLEQQAVILAGERQALAGDFLAFCLGKAGRKIIAQAGYGLPETE